MTRETNSRSCDSLILLRKQADRTVHTRISYACNLIPVIDSKTKYRRCESPGNTNRLGP